MLPTDAAKILDLPPDATPDQLEARFNELRAKLEDKIAKAPTPGLKAKYRETLDQITQAFETLTLAADSSSLPVLQKQRTDDGGPRTAGGTATPPRDPRPQSPAPKPPARKSGREFALVAIIAVAVLGAGGWWVMKTRAENAEKARIVAEAKASAEAKTAAEKAEQERKAEEARLAAEAKRQTEEAEKARLALGEKAERERQDRLFGQLRGSLAEHRIAWEAIEREERSAERRLSELKSDLRSLRDAPAGRLGEAQAVVAAHQEYYDWLSDTLAKHPAKIARGRAEELLSAQQVDDAQAAVQELASSLGALEAEIPRQREVLLDLDGELTITTNPDTTWTLTEAFGRIRTGKGPAAFNNVSVGQAEVKLSRAGWPPRLESVIVRRVQPATLEAIFAGTDVHLVTSPAGAHAFGPGGRDWGTTPVQLNELPPGSYHVTFKLAGHYDEPVRFRVPESGAEVSQKLRARATKPTKPEWRLPTHFVIEHSFNMATDGNRSTGTFAKDAASYNSQSGFSYQHEYMFSQHDANGDWTNGEVRVLSHSSVPAANGSVSRMTRQPDGKWAFHAADGTVTTATLDPTWGNAWLDEAWPPADIQVGGTWVVDSKAGVPHIGQPGQENQITGTLVAFDRAADADWATLQFKAEHLKKGDAETRASGSVRVRVNLGDGYIASIETTNIQSMTVKAMLIGQIGTDTRTTANFKMTVR